MRPKSLLEEELMTGTARILTSWSMRQQYPFLFMQSVGYFIEPTIVETTNPKNKLMEEVRLRLKLPSCSH